MKRKLPAILLLLIFTVSISFFTGCEKDEVKKTYVVTYKVKFTGNLTDNVQITYNDHTASVNPSTSSEWSNALQFQSGQSVNLRAMVQDDDCGRVSVTATILVNGSELCTKTESGDCLQSAYVMGSLPKN